MCKLKGLCTELILGRGEWKQQAGLVAAAQADLSLPLGSCLCLDMSFRTSVIPICIVVQDKHFSRFRQIWLCFQVI